MSTDDTDGYDTSATDGLDGFDGLDSAGSTRHPPGASDDDPFSESQPHHSPHNSGILHPASNARNPQTKPPAPAPASGRARKRQQSGARPSAPGATGALPNAQDTATGATGATGSAHQDAKARWRKGRRPAQQNFSNGRNTDKKFVKATREEIEERVEFIAKMLARFVPKSQIKAMVRKRFSPDPENPLSARQIEDYIARAKAYNLKISSKSAAELRADLNAVLEGVISDPEATPKDRVYAVEASMRLHGIDQLPPAPSINIGVNVDGPVVPIVEIEISNREDLAKILEDPQIARMAFSGRLPGIPKKAAEEALQRLGMIVDGKVVDAKTIDEKVVDGKVVDASGDIDSQIDSSQSDGSSVDDIDELEDGELLEGEEFRIDDTSDGDDSICDDIDHGEDIEPQEIVEFDYEERSDTDIG